jgi:hypothetical protein
MTRDQHNNEEAPLQRRYKKIKSLALDSPRFTSLAPLDTARQVESQVLLAATEHHVSKLAGRFLILKIG